MSSATTSVESPESSFDSASSTIEDSVSDLGSANTNPKVQSVMVPNLQRVHFADNMQFSTQQNQ